MKLIQLNRFECLNLNGGNDCSSCNDSFWARLGRSVGEFRAFIDANRANISEEEYRRLSEKFRFIGE